MQFRVIKGDSDKQKYRSTVLLLPLSWNDWWTYRTSYYMYFVDETGSVSDIGGVKIGDLETAYLDTSNDEGTRTPLPETFVTLSGTYVSVGQDESFYENLRTLGLHDARNILESIHDIVQNPEIYHRVKDEPLVRKSLMRSVPENSVQGVFRKIIEGSEQTTSNFNFAFVKENGPDWGSSPLRLEITVEPSSTPPTNVHVLVGRNGSGKTTLLSEVTNTILGLGSSNCRVEQIRGDVSTISNVVHIGFSAFDLVKVPIRDDSDSYSVAYSYVGLHHQESSDFDDPNSFLIRPADALAGQFADSAYRVISEKSRDLWRQSLNILESDPNFAEFEIADMAGRALEDEAAFKHDARELFGELSSGHKIVLLSTTRILETVTEQSLVVIDEPEGHLHPPLLAAFIRALSNILQVRNGVAIIATHSPVVLQEVPLKCVTAISKFGELQRADRPEIQTFGENVGVLTNSIFGLEVQNSGFHKLLHNMYLDHLGEGYSGILDALNGEVGFEGRALLHSWVAQGADR